MKEHFSINVTNQANSTIVKRLRVVSVDDSTKQLTAMFGGAESGVFSVSLRHNAFGLVGTAGLTLTVGSTVTSVTPMIASIYGGTVLTITGTNFGTVSTDNPVQISYNGGVGSTHCFVLTTSATQITCSLDDTITKTAGTSGTVVVFLKASEEATCAASVCGSFTFTAALPTITAATTNFDVPTNTWELVVSGSSLPSATSNSILTVDGVAQTAKSSTASEAVFTFTDLKLASTNMTGMKLSFAEGKPEGHLILDAGVAITPRLVSITPNAGSVGGTTIIASVPGAGLSTQGLQIQNSAGSSICTALRVVAYGKVECDTKAEVLASGALKVVVGTESFACVDTAGTACNYEQSAAAVFPAVDSATLTATSIVFTGTNFLTTGHTAKSSLSGVSADTVVVDSTSQVTATWTLGTPFIPAALSPLLMFTHDASGVAYKATTTATVTNPLTVSSSSQGLSCSFAGGCLMTVAANGLSQMMKSDPTNNFITVCEEKCLLSETDSSPTEAKCLLPAVSTIYSNTNFMILSPAALNGTLTASSLTPWAMFDGSITNWNEESSANTVCHATMAFKAGHVAILDKVKYYLDASLDKVATFVDKLKF